MKKTFILLALILCANIGYSQTFYTVNGTLLSNRTVTLDGKSLNFTPSTSPSTGNLFINGTNGNIGLGTTSPSSKFQINSGDIFLNSSIGKLIVGTVANFNDSSYNWAIKSERPFLIASSTLPTLQIRSTVPGGFGFLDLAIAPNDYGFSNNSKKGDVVLRGYTTGSMIINCQGSGNIKFTTISDNLPTTVSKVQMLITKTGNIGIGTETPDAKLAVNGMIHSKEVLVDLLGWPDYVFENEYDLKSLNEVEQFIKDNGHLPNVPSAAQVEEEGIELGEMAKIQQEKIEELTLYIIEQNKVNEKQTKEIEELKQLVNQLITKK